jgi:hypothetical protein
VFEVIGREDVQINSEQMKDIISLVLQEEDLKKKKAQEDLKKKELDEQKNA